MSKALGKTEWITAGLKLLAKQGVDAVKVEPLAAALGVTKGSFYWLFKGRPALLSAILEAWQARATTDIIDQVESLGGGAKTRLRNLFEIVLDSGGRLEMAVRAWAANDPGARAAVADIDKRRLDYLEALFSELGFSAPEAAARARLVYHALIGQFAMGRPAKPQNKPSQQLDIIFNMLVRTGKS